MPSVEVLSDESSSHLFYFLWFVLLILPVSLLDVPFLVVGTVEGILVGNTLSP